MAPIAGHVEWCDTILASCSVHTSLDKESGHIKISFLRRAASFMWDSDRVMGTMTRDTLRPHNRQQARQHQYQQATDSTIQQPGTRRKMECFLLR
mmetsp:Transcript_22117/g.69194  ORF Transcript_22117/g.69194 Transcript_22117/m.69194 type:complete len:95 (+) Transcript_22117:808-1092(+)